MTETSLTRPPIRRRLRRPALSGESRSLVVISLVVLVTVIAHRIGDLLPETKLDLLVDPARFLSRATFLWDPAADFGRIQNQAVGYFWPMGPFFLGGRAIGLPAWFVQRLWISGLVLVALWGMHTVLTRLQVGNPASRVIAATSYALAPSFLSTIMFQSAGQIPAALLPWVMVPLLSQDSNGRLRRGATWRSALAVATIGGVNGAAAVIVLAVPVMWLFSRAHPLQRWRLIGSWAGASLLGMVWWLAPLALQGRYGFNFIAFTEQASSTTATQSATEAIRGTGSWLSYLVVDGRPIVPGARLVAIDRASIVATLLVAGVGLAGLLRRDLRERVWLVSIALVGLVATGFAYVGPLDGLLAGPGRALLDGVIAPLRNVQKFAPLVRFALAIGVAHLLAVGSLPRWTRIGRSPQAARIVLGALLFAAVFPAARAQQSGLSSDGAFAKIPDYWVQTVRWLDQNGDSRRTLLAPSSPFGEYTWGRPLDEPIQTLSNKPWAVRSIIPLGGTGSTRLMDEFDRRLVSRQLGPGTSEVLARMGIRFVLIRNDLDRPRTFSPSPAIMRQALEAAPGLDRVAAFGPVVGRSLLSDQLTPDFGPSSGDDIRAVEIWRVRTPTNRITTYDAASTMAVAGGPESLFELADADVLSGRATVLANAGRSSLPTATWAITDATRRRDATFATVRKFSSYSLTPQEDAPNTDAAPRDRLDPSLIPVRSTAELTGAASIEGSSYSVDDTTRYPGTQPWAAFDANAASAWRPAASASAVGAWVEVTFDEPVAVPTVAVRRPADDVAKVRAVRVSTDRGSTTASFGDENEVDARLPPGATKRIRVEITDAVQASSGFGSPGISDIDLGGVDLERPIRAESARPGWATTSGPPVVALDRYRVDATNRLQYDEDATLDRTFTLDEAASYDIAVGGSPRPGPALDELVKRVRTVLGAVDRSVEVSSVWQDLPAFDSAAAHDDDLSTSWVADVGDDAPSITITWDDPVTLSQVHLTTPGFPAEAIGRVRLDAPSGRRTVVLDQEGVGRFAPLTTRSVTVELPSSGGRPLSIAQPLVRSVSELSFNVPIPSVRSIDPDQTVLLGCDDGPTVKIDGTIIPASAATTWAKLLAQEPALLQPCRPRVDLPTGDHRITTTASGPFQIDSLALEPPDRPPAAPARISRIKRWESEDRTVEVDEGPAAILTTTENANDGWVATYAGQRLEPIIVDGWRQGWLLPQGPSGSVRIIFRPGSTHRRLLALGLMLALILCIGSLRPVRRLALGRRGAGADTEPASGLGPVAVIAISAACMALLAGPLLVFAPLLYLARRSGALTFALGAALSLAGAALLDVPVGSTLTGTGTFSALAQSGATVAIGALAIGLLRSKPVSDEGS